jgi:hypothetical protein
LNEHQEKRESNTSAQFISVPSLQIYAQGSASHHGVRGAIPALKVESDEEVRQRDLDVSSFGFPFWYPCLAMISDNPRIGGYERRNGSSFMVALQTTSSLFPDIESLPVHPYWGPRICK